MCREEIKKNKESTFGIRDRGMEDRKYIRVKVSLQQKSLLATTKFGR